MRSACSCCHVQGGAVDPDLSILQREFAEIVDAHGVIIEAMEMQLGTSQATCDAMPVGPARFVIELECALLVTRIAHERFKWAGRFAAPCCRLALSKLLALTIAPVELLPLP